ncbi:tryptophan-rich sensory protein [Candidatus Woesebacteria bacterium]|nr:tryptophan-rich sensory protein [Candidatus Woesebacteria bacterium]
MKKIDLPKLVASLAFPFIAGAIGSFFTFPSIASWYAQLTKPSFSPPNWLFGPVWTILYILMGISLYLVWKKYLKLFLLHLIINAAWSVVFFGLHDLGLALLVIGFLWAIIAYMILKFYKVSKIASYLLIPYILWVSFATILNLSLYLLNK